MIRLRVIDFETNGEAPPAEVIEVGMCDLVQTDAEWVVAAPEGYLCGLPEGVSLDPAARAVHHITPQEIVGNAPFSAIAVIDEARAYDAFALVAHSWGFEGKWLIPELMGELRALCTWKAALRVWPDAPSHSLGALRYWLEDQGLISLDYAIATPMHRAAPDAYVTAHLLKALLAETTGREMIAWTREPALLPRCPIGEPQGWKGKKWSEIDGGFLLWMTRQTTMEDDLKWNARRELDRREADQTGGR